MAMYRYAIQRLSDGKIYKNVAAIYPTIESYWTHDMTKARLWLYPVNWGAGYKTLTFELVLQKEKKNELSQRKMPKAH